MLVENMKKFIATSTIAFALCTPSAYADTPEQERAKNNDTIEEVLIRAHPLSGEGLAQASLTLRGKLLDQKVAASLGATLESLPGITSSSFGDAVGRPVIRGLSGTRVRVMEDRLSTMDVSVVSGDHATTVEPFIADQIEVLKGPSTLLYGSSAIGGVVDVHTGRVPHPGDTQKVSGKFAAEVGDNGDQENLIGRIDGGGKNFLWHVDAFNRQADDYDIPGFTESAAQIAAEEAGHTPGEEEEEEELVRGTLPGSHYETNGGALGLSYANSKGFIGMAVSRTEALYGLPGGHEHGHDEDHDEEHEGEHGDEEGTPVLDMKQTRVDLEGGLTNPLGGAFDSLNVRIGHNDYEHSEIEPDGEQATFFENDAIESRVELTRDRDNARDVIGVQYDIREFSVVGEEAFLPGVDTKSLAGFWLRETRFDRFNLETGARFESVNHEPAVGLDRDFNTFSASAGIVYPVTDNLTYTMSIDYAQRAPVGEELYSFGPHLATSRFEIGSDNLKEEEVLGATLGIAYNSEAWDMNLSVYRSSFSDFIYQRSDNRELDELPVFVWDQDDANVSGLEGEIRYRVAGLDDKNLSFRGFFDMVNTDLKAASDNNLPLIPPTRLGLGSNLSWQNFAFSVDYIHSFEQDEQASFELPSQSYNDLSMHIAWYIPTQLESEIEIFLRGDNLTDDEQRQHTSFIKDTAPAPGRRLSLGLRYTF